MDQKVLITPSILSADLGHLQQEVESVQPYADWLQVDVMDGHFVPNISFGAPVVRCLTTTLPLDIHLMVQNPADRIAEFLVLGVKHITFHAEVVEGVNPRLQLIDGIRKGGATAGIALNPKTPLSAIDDIVEDLNLVLIMSVQPGSGGQEFRPEVLDKVRLLRKQFPYLMIQIDGGVDADTAMLCRQAGANNLVAGTSVFGAADRAAAIAALRGI